MIHDLLMLLATVALANVVGRAASRVGVPDLIGFILVGLIVGPAGLDIVGYHDSEVGRYLWNSAADIGLLALMAAAGLSMSEHLAIKHSKRVAVLAGAILICLVPAFLSAPWMMGAGFDPIGSSKGSAATAYQCVLALAVIVTSVPFITKILANNGLLGTPFATTVLCTACAVDLVVWALVPFAIDMKEGVRSDFVALMTPALATMLMLGSMLALMRVSAPVKPRFLKLGATSTALVRLMLLVSLSALFVAAFDVSLMIAALAFGLCLGRIRLPPTTPVRSIRRVCVYLFIPAFFSLVGLKLQLEGNLIPLLILGFLLWSTILKMACICGAALLMRMSMVDSVSYGFALNTRGGPGIALATVTLNAGVIGGATLITLIFASVATTLMANMALRLVLHRESFSGSPTHQDVLGVRRSAT